MIDIQDSVNGDHVMSLVKIGQFYRSYHAVSGLSAVLFANEISTQAEEIAHQFKVKLYKISDL